MKRRANIKANLSIKAAAGMPTRFDILAYTGGPLNVDGFDLPVVVELKGMEASGNIPIAIKHDTSDEMILGETDAKGIKNDGKSLRLSGPITADPDQSPVVKRVLTMARKGHHWQASIGADLDELQEIAEGETITANGREQTGPFIYAPKSVLRETSVLGMGADKNTRVLLAQAKGAAAMSFEDWAKSKGFDVATLSDDAKQFLMQQYAAEQEATADPDEETEVDDLAAEGDPDEEETDVEAETDETEEDPEKKKPVAAKAKATNPKLQAHHLGPKYIMAKSKASIQAANKAYADNARRIAKIEALCVNDHKLRAHAIEKGWSAERTELEALKRQQRANVPAGHRRDGSNEGMLQALQGAMILRAGGRLDHEAYTGHLGLALNLPRWLRAGINSDTRQKAMESAWEFRDLSMVDLCRAACRIDGREPTERSHRGYIQAAVSGGSLADIFTTNINAVFVQKFVEAGDTTAGWTKDADANNFMTMERTRLVKGPRLTRHARGGEADNATRSDAKETYKIARYSHKFSVDEMDIIDDYFKALSDIPDEMALACSRLRPDLVYSILLANAALEATGVALFSASQPESQSNLAASGGTLASGTLQAGIASMTNIRENGVNLGLYPSHLLVPAVLEGTACNLLQGQNIAAGAATTNAGDINPLKSIQDRRGKIEVVVDPRLTNGVVDPVTDTSYSGSASTWRLVSNKGPTIEVAYLKGSGKAPQVRQFQMTEGKWGIGWDVAFDIGAKALSWHTLYEART